MLTIVKRILAIVTRILTMVKRILAIVTRILTIVKSQTSSRQKMYCRFIQETNRKRTKDVTFRPQGFIRHEDMTRRLDENEIEKRLEKRL